ALGITSQIFEAMGARATSARYGFDRFWRNVRVHSLHDPIDYKVRDLGHWLLSGQGPAPSLYSCGEVRHGPDDTTSLETPRNLITIDEEHHMNFKTLFG